MNEVNEASPVERVVSRDEDVIASTLLDITDPIQYGAEQFWCAMRVLDDMNIPRSINGERLSLVGRIKLLQALLTANTRIQRLGTSPLE